jgi:hypothetical protein
MCNTTEWLLSKLNLLYLKHNSLSVEKDLKNCIPTFDMRSLTISALLYMEVNTLIDKDSREPINFKKMGSNSFLVKAS